MVSIGTRLAYGSGSIGEITTSSVFNAFTFFYYTQILGLAGTLAGLAVTIALVFDAVTDPLMGTISDRWRSRFGRRHPFMFVASVPLGLVFFLVFSPPDGLEGFALFIWFTGFTILLRGLMTLYAVPHLALGAEISSDYHERSKIMSYNLFMGTAGGVGMVFIGLTWFFNSSPEYDNGLMNPKAYPTFALVCGFVISISILACAWFTRGHIPHLSKPPANQPTFSFGTVINEIGQAFKNTNYRYLLVGLFFLSLLIGIHETLSLHMSTFFWEFKPEQIRLFPIASVLGVTLAFAITTKLHRRLEKRGSIIIGVVGIAVITSAPIVLRMFGLFPENGTTIILLTMIVVVLLATACAGIANISVMSALADIADEHELKSGRRQEGIFYSARLFFSKCTTALGHLLAGIAIDVIGFPLGVAPGEVEAEKVFQLGMVYGPVAAIPGFIAIFFYARYRLNKTKLTRIQAQLAERKAAADGGADGGIKA